MSILIAGALIASTLFAPAATADELASCRFPVVITRDAEVTTDPISGGEVHGTSLGLGDIVCAAGEKALPTGHDAAIYGGQKAWPLAGQLAGFWLRGYDGSALPAPLPADGAYTVEQEATGEWLDDGAIVYESPGGTSLEVAVLATGEDVLIPDGYTAELDGTEWTPVRVVETGTTGWVDVERLGARTEPSPTPTPSESATAAPTEQPTADPTAEPSAAPNEEPEDGAGFEVDANVLIIAGAIVALCGLVLASRRVKRKEKTESEGVL